MNKERIVTISVFVLAVCIFGLAAIIAIKYKHANQQIVKLEQQLEDQKISMKSEINILEEEIKGLTMEMEENQKLHEEELEYKISITKETIYNEEVEYITDKTNCTDLYDLVNNYLINENKTNEYENKLRELNAVIEDLVTRIEIYENYEYCFFDTTGKKNDLTADDIEYLEEILTSEYCDDVDLYLAWIMIESEGYAKCKNPNSTAKGLSQFLDGTSKTVYSKMGYTDAWYPEIVFKKDICLSMMVRYVNDLIDDYHGDLHKAINCYRGLYDAPYLRNFDKYLATKGKSIDSIANETLSRYTMLKEMEKVAVG